MLAVPSIEQHNALQLRVESMDRELNQALVLLKQCTAKPVEWWTQSEANKLFIGRGGKPVDRHTFARMVTDWIRAGELIEGVNYKTGNGNRFISVEFLKEGMKERKQKLRVA